MKHETNNAHPRWVSVAIRKPKTGGKYTVISDGCVYVGYAILHKKLGWIDSVSWFELTSVTHWLEVTYDN